MQTLILNKLKRPVFTTIIIGLTLCTFSCKKNQLGGKSIVNGVVLHYSKAIANATVFIKFNSKTFPGADTNLYDARVRADAKGNYAFNCYGGDYFLYGYGIDNAVSPPRVVGGVSLHIRYNEKIEQNIAVIEN